MEITTESERRQLESCELVDNQVKEDERMETLVGEIKDIFASLGDGNFSPTAYDTAWVARIPSIEDPRKPQFPSTIEWITKNQMEDGSWGDHYFFMVDRLISTLSCVITLKLWKHDDGHINKGIQFLQTHLQDLDYDKGLGRTIGFEILFPSLLNEAKSLGLDLPYELSYMKHISKLREKKMSRIPLEMLHSVRTTLLFSLEGIQDLVQWNIIMKLQSQNGSFSDSPAATAAAYLNTRDKKCLEYLTYVVSRFQDHAILACPMDNFERIWMVDTIERLGIEHFFREEISNTLDYLYRHLRKDGMTWGRDAYIADIDDTSMALRLFRLHGYPVSSDVLELYKDDDNSFIEWSLRNPWKITPPWIGVREYIDNYGDKDVWIGKCLYRGYNINNSKYLELAKLEYNKLQVLHKREINSIQQWWKSCGFDDPKITQVNPQNIHFSICVTMYENKFSATRIAYTKCNSLENLLKDIFQNHESIEDLQLFSRAINEWKPSLITTLPASLQRVFRGVYETMNELAIKANSIQGKDGLLYLHDLRKLQVQEYLNIRQFKDANHFECLEEYVEQVKRGLGISIRLLPAMFLMEGVLQEKALQYLDPRSKMHEQSAFILALLNPVIEDWTAVSIYMNKYNCSKEDAIGYIENKIDDAFAELTHEYLKPSNHALDSCRRLIFEHVRITRFYLDRVGNDQFDEVMKRAYTPIP
ncbi:hypothetical protein HPP92_004533 [Vanilla planifolia]|uniref:Uncharacterized protein n=1 Tax=Vanilla planifolia TaxID=51239 RepID=A0A835VAH0_VANPL|nr:hypothetical protein HPP92_004533 [Vanilla planifolia]